MSMQQNSPDTKFCPRIGEPCIEAACIDWIAFPATKVNELTGKKVQRDHYMCALHWQVKIAFDSAKLADQAGASIDDLRNHVARGNRQRIALQIDPDAREKLEGYLLEHPD